MFDLNMWFTTFTRSPLHWKRQGKSIPCWQLCQPVYYVLWWALTSGHSSFLTPFLSSGQSLPSVALSHFYFVGWRPKISIKCSRCKHPIWSYTEPRDCCCFAASPFIILPNTWCTFWKLLPADLWDSPSSPGLLAWGAAAALEEPEAMATLVLGQGSRERLHEKRRI